MSINRGDLRVTNEPDSAHERQKPVLLAGIQYLTGSRPPTSRVS